MTTIDRITHTTILCQVLQNYLGNDMANGFFKQSLKASAKNFLGQLQEVERKQYDEFFNKIESSTCEVYDVMDEFFKTISKVEIPEMQNICAIIKAYEKDPKSVEGICNKILR